MAEKQTQTKNRGNSEELTEIDPLSTQQHSNSTQFTHRSRHACKTH